MSVVADALALVRRLGSLEGSPDKQVALILPLILAERAAAAPETGSTAGGGTDDTAAALVAAGCDADWWAIVSAGQLLSCCS